MAECIYTEVLKSKNIIMYALNLSILKNLHMDKSKGTLVTLFVERLCESIWIFMKDNQIESE